jgi:hypothetical protein
MISEFDRPAMRYKVQWYEWHPRGWALEWMPFSSLEEAKTAEQGILFQSTQDRPHVVPYVEGEDPVKRITELNRMAKT